MNLRRIAKHLLTPDWVALRAFPAATLQKIETAIAESERKHRGELRFAVEAGLPLSRLLPDQPPRRRAEDVFSQLRVWDTAENSGVLVYVQLVDRDIEIVADRGIAAKVPQAQWEEVCQAMETAFRAQRFEEGALSAIARIEQLLALHFPPDSANVNELPDRPTIL